MMLERAFREWVTNPCHLPTIDCSLDMKSNHLTRPVTPPSSIGPWRPPYRDRLLSTSCRENDTLY